MTNRKSVAFSISLKCAIIIFIIVGFTLIYLYGHVHGLQSLLYFTIQSNTWLMIYDLVLVILMIKSLVRPNYKLSHNAMLVRQIFTVCITITGFVYCAILVPGFYASKQPLLDGYTPFNAAAVLLHMVVLILAIADFFLFTRGEEFKNKECLWTAIPPIYYLFFSLIVYHAHWDFGDGRNYPYFFLNYDSPAGFFGFSDVMPYFMGSFYWMIILVLPVFGLSLLYIVLINKLIKKQNTSCNK